MTTTTSVAPPMTTTTYVAIYAAAVATVSLLIALVVAWLTFQRDRQRLRVAIGWITGPRLGITVRCVNTGFRPVSVMNVYFTRLDAPRAKFSMNPAAYEKGWVGTAYGAGAPSADTPLPVRLEPAEEATQHYAIDDKFGQADGVIVYDTSNRAYTHRFAALDRVGFAHALATRTGWRLLSVESVNELASDIARYGDSGSCQELRRLATEAGPGGMVQLWVEDDEEARTLRLRWVRPGQRPAIRQATVLRVTVTCVVAVLSGAVVSVPLSVLGVNDLVTGLLSLLVTLLVLQWLGLRLTGVGLWPSFRRKVRTSQEPDQPLIGELFLHTERSAGRAEADAPDADTGVKTPPRRRQKPRRKR